MPSGPVTEEVAAQLAADFDREYGRLYGEGARSIFQALEIFSLRVQARVPLEFVPVLGASENGGLKTVTSERVRPVYWPEEHGWVPTAVHDGRYLRPGNQINGPAVVELPYTTVAVSGGSRLTLDSVGNYVLQAG
jgi:N-methylhydantoinase A/oxoprolinase/acetone carboxylase beta subunit